MRELYNNFLQSKDFFLPFEQVYSAVQLANNIIHMQIPSEIFVDPNSRQLLPIASSSLTSFNNKLMHVFSA